jgi:bifunctional DNA-binding transcriptional regulator/antitoxin component of YhaV-PrlF toxin-antitoxin module
MQRKPYTVTISSRGQVTIPVVILRKWGVKPIDKVKVEVKQGQAKLTLIPALLESCVYSTGMLTRFILNSQTELV